MSDGGQLLGVSPSKVPQGFGRVESCSKSDGVLAARHLSYCRERSYSPVADLVWRHDRSDASTAMFYDWLGPKKSQGIHLAVTDMWKPFRR